MVEDGEYYDSDTEALIYKYRHHDEFDLVTHIKLSL